MKWLVTFIVVVQLPFLFISFIAAGTDGHGSSVLLTYPLVILITLSGAYSVLRLFSASRIGWADVGVSVVACLPVLVYIAAALHAFFGKLAG
jgi:hypothetical protein